MATKTKTGIEPLEDRVVIRPLDAEEVTSSGLVIPDTAKEKPQEGEVLAVGPGRVGRQRQARARRGEGRRPRPVLEVRGNRGQDRRRRAPRRTGARHPRAHQVVQRSLAMPSKELLFRADARRALEEGVDRLANAVRITLGPRGRNVVLEKKWGAPVITNDGVTIAKEVEVEERFENLGAQLAKEVASKTNDVAGDGTTTATVLAQAMVHEGMRNVAAGANADRSAPRHREGRGGCGRGAPRASKRHLGTQRDRASRSQLRSRSRDRRHDRRGHGQGRQGRRHHRRGVADLRSRARDRSKVCSSTADTSRRTSSPIRTGWKRSSKNP